MEWVRKYGYTSAGVGLLSCRMRSRAALEAGTPIQKLEERRTVRLDLEVEMAEEVAAVYLKKGPF